MSRAPFCCHRAETALLSYHCLVGAAPRGGRPARGAPTRGRARRRRERAGAERSAGAVRGGVRGRDPGGAAGCGRREAGIRERRQPRALPGRRLPALRGAGRQGNRRCGSPGPACRGPASFWPRTTRGGALYPARRAAKGQRWHLWRASAQAGGMPRTPLLGAGAARMCWSRVRLLRADSLCTLPSVALPAPQVS
jgi:hypothetical protein